MAKKLGIGGFNAFMQKKTGPGGPMASVVPRGPMAARADIARKMAERTIAPRAQAARQVQQRAGAARTVSQGRVVAAQRKAAARGRGR